MPSTLITYATMAGATRDIAERIGEVLRRQQITVDILPMDQVHDLDNYQTVIVGAPMIMGWHRRARAFLRRHRSALSHIPHAIFVTAMTVTDAGPYQPDGVTLFLDPQLLTAPANGSRLTLRERYATLSNYLAPILRLARPRAVGVFAGRLEYGRLPRWAVVFAMLFVRARPGDRRDWEAIEAWAADLPAHLALKRDMELAPAPVHAPSL